MILDSSAVVAIFLREPGFEGLLDHLEAAPGLAMGAPTLCETGIVLSHRLGSDFRSRLAFFLSEYQVETLSFGPTHWKVAIEAFATYGRGRHAAALNFGDCMSYATARLAGEALLFVGNDFSHTDLLAA